MSNLLRTGIAVLCAAGAPAGAGKLAARAAVIHKEWAAAPVK